MDPSIINFDSFQVTLYGREPKDELVPVVEQGHVILLCGVKVLSQYSWKRGGGLDVFTGTVYHDRLEWIAYNPSDGKVFFANSAVDLGGLKDPFHQATREEVEYMCNLGMWWTALQETKEKQDKPGYTQNLAPITYRPLCPIGDLGVNVFFDAVVEVNIRLL